PWNERLGIAKDFVVFLRRDVAIVQSGNDCAVRVWKFSFTVGLDRYIVAQNSSETVEVAFFVGHGNQPPVAVSRGNFDSEDWDGLIIGATRCRGHGGYSSGHRYNCNQQESNPCHAVPPSNIRNVCVYSFRKAWLD